MEVASHTGKRHRADSVALSERTLNSRNPEPPRLYAMIEDSGRADACVPQRSRQPIVADRDRRPRSVYPFAVGASENGLNGLSLARTYRVGDAECETQARVAIVNQLSPSVRANIFTSPLEN